jgi:heme exporter protein D|tara:strand:- start:642 stop:809 length:168 start_codon:yes stop_codon:yes gene_type:complete
MMEFFAMDYAFYVYSSLLAFLSVIIICTKDAFRHLSKTLGHIKNTIHQMESDNET